MRAGGVNLLIPNPRDMAGFVKELSKYQVSFFPAVNTLYNGLLHTPGFDKLDFSKLKVSNGGGMAVQKAVAESWLKTTGCPLAEGYGLSETSPALTCNPATIDRFTGSIGVPIPSTYISIRDDDGNEVPLGQPGEICAKGPQVMAGYWNRPDETAQVMTADGYFRTGDIGVMTPDDASGRVIHYGIREHGMGAAANGMAVSGLLPAVGTFFVLGWLAEREPQMVRAIAAAGHEIGSHSWDHAKVTSQSSAQFRESLDVIGAAGTRFDVAEYLAGRQTPVFFGSAMTNFGLEPFLRALVELAPPPQPRASDSGIVSPTDERFTGFVFKIQANMDPRHRDRVAPWVDHGGLVSRAPPGELPLHQLRGALPDICGI